MLKFLLAAVMLAQTGGPAEQILVKRAEIPVVACAAISAEHAVAFHIDSSITFLSVAGGELCVSIGDDAGDDPNATGDLPVLRTQYKDAKGATHEVVTPVASVTEAGMKRAMETHKALLALMQAEYPPAKE